MNDETNLHPVEREERWLPLVRQLLRGLRFGTVQIVVQDSKAIQVEKIEKVRLPAET